MCGLFHFPVWASFSFPRKRSMSTLLILNNSHKPECMCRSPVSREHADHEVSSMGLRQIGRVVSLNDLRIAIFFPVVRKVHAARLFVMSFHFYPLATECSDSCMAIVGIAIRRLARYCSACAS